MKSKKPVLGISLIAIVLINFLVFKISLKKEVDLIKLPVSNETIYPRQKITKDDIDYIEVPSVFVSDLMFKEEDEIINMYSDIQTRIPKNSPFYKENLFKEEDLPDYPSILLKEEQVVYNLNTDLIKLSGNSIVVGQKIDIYTTLVKRNEKPIVDLLVSSVRVIGVKDKKGLDISNPESNKIPYIVLLAIDKDIMPLVRSSDEIAKLELYAHSKDMSEDESILNEDAKILEYIHNE